MAFGYVKKRFGDSKRLQDSSPRKCVSASNLMACGPKRSECVRSLLLLRPLKKGTPKMIDSAYFEDKKAAYYTLGCKLNFAETSAIGRELADHGIRRVRAGEQADVCVVNT